MDTEKHEALCSTSLCPGSLAGSACVGDAAQRDGSPINILDYSLTPGCILPAALPPACLPQPCSLLLTSRRHWGSHPAPITSQETWGSFGGDPGVLLPACVVLGLSREGRRGRCCLQGAGLKGQAQGRSRPGNQTHGKHQAPWPKAGAASAGPEQEPSPFLSSNTTIPPTSPISQHPPSLGTAQHHPRMQAGCSPSSHCPPKGPRDSSGHCQAAGNRLGSVSRAWGLACSPSSLFLANAQLPSGIIQQKGSAVAGHFPWQMLSRGASCPLPCCGTMFDPANTLCKPSCSQIPHSLRSSVTLQQQKTWRDPSHVVGITRLHARRQCGVLMLGGISRPISSQALWEEWEAALSPSFPERLVQLGRKWLHVLSQSRSQAPILGSVRGS